MCHVLIIEDEPMIAMLIQGALEESGATSFSIAATEAEALELAHQERPAVITADFQLVEGTGQQAVNRIHACFGDIPVMFLTGNPDALDQPIRAPVLTKPASIYQIQEVFGRLVSNARPI